MKRKEFLIDLLLDFIAGGLYALGIYTFISSADFAPGGIGGVSLIISYLTNLPIGFILLVINIPLAIFAYSSMGKTFIFKSLKTMLIQTIFLDYIIIYIPQYQGEILLKTIFGSLFMGISFAIYYLRGSSSGGSDFITLPLKKKYPHLSIGSINGIFNLLVILAGAIVYANVDAILYGLISIYITSIVVDKLMYGINSSKLVTIICESSSKDMIASDIASLTKRSSTQVMAKGSYSKDDKYILYCACSSRQAQLVRKIVYQNDTNAIVMISNTNEVFGNGFLSAV